MHPAPTACALALLATLAGANQGGPTLRRALLQVELQPIALSGEQAPGLGAGGLFTFFGVPPGVGMPTFGAATLDLQGNLAFTAFANDTSGNPSGMAGVWRRTGPTLAPVALRGAPAPGTPAAFQFFPNVYFGSTPQVVGGDVLFQASLTSPPGDPIGLWWDRSGALELVAVAGQTLPGLPPGSQIQTPSGVLGANRIVVLHANYAFPGSAGDELEAFWRDDAQAAALVVRDNTQAPGCAAGVVFGEANQFARGAFDDWDASANGSLAFSGFVKGAGVALDNDEGIWAEDAVGLRLVARERAAAPGAGPGAIFLDGPGLHTFTVGGSAYHAGVRINEAGTVLFGAGLAGSGFDHGDSLWLHRGGLLVLIAKAFSGASSFHADPAPGFPAGITFGAFGTQVWLNAHDDVAFSAMVSNGETGIWWTRGGALELVARSGGTVPELPGATFQNYGLLLGELGDSGSLLFKGSFTGPGISHSNGSALFLADAFGAFRMLVRKGQIVDVAGNGTDLRTVEDIGTQDAYEAHGASIKLLFTDGSSGLFTVRLK